MDLKDLNDLKSSIEYKRLDFAGSLIQAYNANNDEIEKAKAFIVIREEYSEYLRKTYKDAFNHDINATLSILDEHSEAMKKIKNNLPWKFWTRSDFPGWKVFVENQITKEDRFLSLNELVNLCGDENHAHRSAIVSAISNALTISFQKKKLGRISIDHFKGFLYGLPEFFDAGSVLPKYTKELELRFFIDVNYLTIEGNADLENPFI